MSSWHDVLIRLTVGRITPSESLFYYDVANGLDYDYYNSSRPYTPVFGIQPTQQQQNEALQVCTTDDGEFNRACAYDFYATGNPVSSGVGANVSSDLAATQSSLGLFVILLASYIRHVHYLLC